MIKTSWRERLRHALRQAAAKRLSSSYSIACREATETRVPSFDYAVLTWLGFLAISGVYD